MKQLMAGGGVALIGITLVPLLSGLFVLSFQGFLIMVCIGICAVLVQSISVFDTIVKTIWQMQKFEILNCGLKKFPTE